MGAQKLESFLLCDQQLQDHRFNLDGTQEYGAYVWNFTNLTGIERYIAR